MSIKVDSRVAAALILGLSAVAVAFVMREPRYQIVSEPVTTYHSSGRTTPVTRHMVFDRRTGTCTYLDDEGCFRTIDYPSARIRATHADKPADK